MNGQKTIAQIAQETNELSTLVKVLKEAGLVDTLSGNQQYTVFAPSNQAFEVIGKQLDEIVANKEELKKILLYHVVPGIIHSQDIKFVKLGDIHKVKTVGGQELQINKQDDKIYVNGALVTHADISASNGVVHIIDEVVIPSTVLQQK